MKYKTVNKMCFKILSFNLLIWIKLYTHKMVKQILIVKNIFKAC